MCYLIFSYWIVVIDNWHYKLIKCKEKGNEEIYDPNVNSVGYQGCLGDFPCHLILKVEQVSQAHRDSVPVVLYRWEKSILGIEVDG